MKTRYILICSVVISACFPKSTQTTDDATNNGDTQEKVVSVSTQDSSINNDPVVDFDPNTGWYSLTIESAEKGIHHLKFAKRIRSSFQTLDQANQIKFYDNELNELEKPNDFFGLCGTVPHYTLSQEETAEAFVLFNDETFYDYKNEEPKMEFARILKTDADSVVFLNGEKEWSFSSNFGIGHIPFADPGSIILFKKNQCAVLAEQMIWYDGFDFSFVSPNLKTKRNTLEGIYTIVEPKYLEIQPFNYYLANVQFIDGEWGFIDHEGNEFR